MSPYFVFVNICFIFMLFSISLPAYSCGNISHRSLETHNGKKPPRLQKGRLGVVSAEKLGCGMTAIAKLEWKVNVIGGNPQQPREQFVGLTGNFGIRVIKSLHKPKPIPKTLSIFDYLYQLYR